MKPECEIEIRSQVMEGYIAKGLKALDKAIISVQMEKRFVSQELDEK